MLFCAVLNVQGCKYNIINKILKIKIEYSNKEGKKII